MKMLLFLLFLLSAVAQAEIHGPALPDTTSHWNVDLLPPLTGLSVSSGGEWVPAQTHGLGLWLSGSVARGRDFIMGEKQDGEMYSVAFTWHPSGKILSGALAVGYAYSSLRSVVQDADKVDYPYSVQGRYLMLEYLNRGLWMNPDGFWSRHFGYRWNAGIGVPLGSVDFHWDTPERMESARLVSKVVRIGSCFDLGVALAWAW